MAEEQIAPTEEIQATPKEEEIASPVEEKKEKPWFKLLLFSILGIVFSAGLIFAGYKLAQLKQVQPSPQPSPTPVAEATPTPDPTANWKTYTIGNASFKYPSTWEVIGQVPEEYKAKEFGEENWEKSKMFSLNCSGPILQNTQAKSTIIAIEVVKPGLTEGSFCWSNGDFRDRYTRTITSLKPPQNIEVDRWKLPEYEEGGVVKAIPWQGDLFQTYDFNKMFKDDKSKPWFIFALVYQEGTDISAESTFDLMLSTFRFTSEEVVGEKVYCEDPRPQVCTMECIQNPPYICGSDGKSYCSECQACADPDIEWYVIQDELCKAE